MRLSMRVWDLPVRLFHWSLTLLLAAAVVTAATGHPALHRHLGEAVLVLVSWRLAWGLVGSDTARFRHFIQGPARLAQDLRALTNRAPNDRAGLGAITGWWLLALLAVLALTCLSGFTPAAAAWHEATVWALGLLVLIHLILLSVTALAGRQPVLRPMLSGKKRLPAALKSPRMVSAWFGVLVLFCVAGAVALVVNWATS